MMNFFNTYVAMYIVSAQAQFTWCHTIERLVMFDYGFQIKLLKGLATHFFYTETCIVGLNLMIKTFL